MHQRQDLPRRHQPAAYLHSRSRGVATAAAALAAALIAACASTPPPTAAVAVSAAAVAHASGAGAPQLAPQEMRLAREKLDRANAAMASQDYGRARSLAEEAQADALLAEARTEALRARKAADDALAANRALGEEMSRKTPTPQ